MRIRLLHLKFLQPKVIIKFIFDNTNINKIFRLRTLNTKHTIGLKSWVMHSTKIIRLRTGAFCLWVVDEVKTDKDQDHHRCHDKSGNLWWYAGPCCQGYKTIKKILKKAMKVNSIVSNLLSVAVRWTLW